MNHYGHLTDDFKRTPLPTNDIRPPSYGGPQRDAINSVVDNIVGDLCGKIGDLRKTLDEFEQQILEGAAGAKAALHDHIAVCVKVNDQIARTRDAVEEIKAAALPLK
jgi:hypothetical protein